MDLKTAVRLSPFAEGLSDDDVIVGNFILRMKESDDSSTSLLKEKFELKLQIERNLDKAFNHRVPDLSVKGEDNCNSSHCGTISVLVHLEMKYLFQFHLS